MTACIQTPFCSTMSFAQYVPFAHASPTDPDEPAVMNDGALLAVLTAIDGDGDTHVATLPIGDKVIVEGGAPLGAQLSAENPGGGRPAGRQQ